MLQAFTKARVLLLRARKNIALATALAAVGTLSTAPLAAQLRPLTPPRIYITDGPSHTVTVNPLLILAGWISGDYEQRVDPSLTLGGGISYFEYGKDHYTTFDARASLYPDGHAMRGFSFSTTLGIAQLSLVDDDRESCHDNCVRRDTTSPAFGIGVNYQWMAGATGRTSAVVGVGGKRFLASKSTLVGTDVVIPTFRLGIGYAW